MPPCVAARSHPSSWSSTTSPAPTTSAPSSPARPSWPGSGPGARRPAGARRCTACPPRSRTCNPTAGVRTTFGSAAYDDYVPETSDGVTLSIEAAGHAVAGQDQHPGVRLALLHRARGPATRGHALGPHPDGRRLLRRCGRGGGGRPGAAGPGVGRRWLDPDPRLLLRTGGSQAVPRPGERMRRRTATRSGSRSPGRSPGPCATRPRCSTCWPDGGWGTRPGRPRRPAPSSRPATASRDACGWPGSPTPVIAETAVDPECLRAWEDASRAPGVAGPPRGGRAGPAAAGGGARLRDLLGRPDRPLPGARRDARSGCVR